MSQQANLNFNDPSYTVDELLILSALSGCIGKDRAVTQYELAEVCKMEPRLVRRTIETLIFKHRKPIGSNPARASGGYFLIANEKEAEEAANRYRKQAVKIFQRAAVVMQISDRELFNQIQMEMEFE